RVFYNQNQKDTLLAWFSCDSCPDKVAREQLAKEIAVLEPKIQNWFKNYRMKQQRQLKSERSSGKEETQKHDHPQCWSLECIPKKAKSDLAATKYQRSKLVQAFERNPFPDIATRTKLAKQIHLGESKIRMWFQNSRSLCQKQSKSEPVPLLIDVPNGTSDQTVQQHQIDLSSLLDGTHLSPNIDFSYVVQW
uniref:Homeobox domain-containing protein n=1 Tax=Otolemur garnettii TaxID=30611 RepID=H0XMX1_OTOGA